MWRKGRFKHLSKTEPKSGERARIAARIREAGRRASAESQARHAAERPSPAQKEIGGADGPDPTRYGDWERKGVASDF
jgi:hypothetical protein